MDTLVRSGGEFDLSLASDGKKKALEHETTSLPR